MFFGSGQLNTPFTFFFSISIPFSPITTPRNPIFFTFYTHFSGLTYKSFSSNLFNTFSTISSCPSFVSVPTNILFTNAATLPSFIKSLKILFIITWNVASKFVIPKNITVGSKDPICIANILFHSSPFFILILLNLYLRSILVNTFLLPMLSINSVINGSR